MCLAGFRIDLALAAAGFISLWVIIRSDCAGGIAVFINIAVRNRTRRCAVRVIFGRRAVRFLEIFRPGKARSLAQFAPFQFTYLDDVVLSVVVSFSRDETPVFVIARRCFRPWALLFRVMICRKTDASSNGDCEQQETQSSWEWQRIIHLPSLLAKMNCA